MERPYNPLSHKNVHRHVMFYSFHLPFFLAYSTSNTHTSESPLSNFLLLYHVVSLVFTYRLNKTHPNLHKSQKKNDTNHSFSPFPLSRLISTRQMTNVQRKNDPNPKIRKPRLNKSETSKPENHDISEETAQTQKRN